MNIAESDWSSLDVYLLILIGSDAILRLRPVAINRLTSLIRKCPSLGVEMWSCSVALSVLHLLTA